LVGYYVKRKHNQLTAATSEISSEYVSFLQTTLIFNTCENDINAALINTKTSDKLILYRTVMPIGTPFLKEKINN